MEYNYTHFGHVAFEVPEANVALDFYINTLGLKEHFTLMDPEKKPWITYLCVSPGEYIEIFHYNRPIRIKEKPSYCHISLLVEDIEQAAKELQEKNVTLWYGPSTLNNQAPVPFEKVMDKTGSYSFFVVDPYGNQIEICQYTDKSLQIQSDETLQELQEHIANNTYVEGACWQGAEMV